MKSIMGWLILFFIFTMGFLGQIMFEEDVEQKNIRNIYNFSEEMLSWDNLTLFKTTDLSSFNNSEYNYSTVTIYRATNIVYRLADTFGYIIFEISKSSIEFGYNYGYKYNLRFFQNLLKWFIFILIITNLTIPLFYVGVLIYLIVIYFKKKIKQLREQSDSSPKGGKENV